ncbi:MAG: DUF1073 domain-containing protein [Oscillospiraceae bacterium]|nr:DUF1073 domain-containing protein [Oscillospiraceae bacterium]
MWFKKKESPKVQEVQAFNEAAFSSLKENITPSEPVTLAKIRLENGASDIGANRGRELYEAHKTKVSNQWINPLQSINSGYGNAQLSIYNYQNVNYFECYALAQDPMMNKIFNVLSETPFANGGEVVSELSEEELKTLDVANKKYNVHKLLVDAVRSNYVTGGCLVFMDFGEDEKLEEPLDLKNKDMKTFKGFRHIDPINVVAIDVNSSEPAKSDYMKPNKWYVVGLGSVHHSRFLKFEENVPELMMRPMTMYFGMPLTLLIKQDVANSNLASQGLANLLNRFRYLYLKTEDQNFTGAGAMNFRKRLETMSLVQDNFGIYPLKSTEDMTQLTTSLAGMAENCEFFFQILAAKTDITMSILLGKGAQGLSGTLEGERKNFYDRIRTIQESVKKNILTIEGIIYGAETDGVYKEFADYVFNPLEQETEREKSENLRSYVEVTKSLVELGVSADKALEWLKGFKDFKLDKVEVDLETPGLFDYDEGGEETDPFTETENSEFQESEHPRDKKGQFSKTVSIDFTKDNILPNLNQEQLDVLGVENKPVLLKKSVIDRTQSQHPEVSPEDYKEIIETALYNPDLVVPGNEKKPYYNFIARVGEDKNSVVLLEVSNEKENFEIVHIHWARDKSRKSLERKGARIEKR